MCGIFVWFPFQCSADTWPVSTICGQQKQSALFLIVFKQFLRRFWKIISLQSQCPILNDVVSFDSSSFCYHEAQAYHSAVIFCFFNQTGSHHKRITTTESSSLNLSQLSGAYQRLKTSLGAKVSYLCSVGLLYLFCQYLRRWTKFCVGADSGEWHGCQI